MTTTFLNRHRQSLIQLTQQLVRIESVNGNETEVAKLLATLLRQHGFRCQLIGSQSKRRSLIATIGRGKRTFMLNGHLDTVAAGERARWRHEPFSGTVSGGRLYGRGAYDMKGAVAAATYAALALHHAETVRAGKLVLVFNADEEGGTHTGIQDVLRHGIHADAAICCEPMLNDTLAIGAKGIYRCEIETIGTGGHTGYPQGKVNAVTKMAKVLLALEALRFKWREQPLFSRPYIVPGTILAGGTAMNIFPERCVAKVDCRLSVGQTREVVKSQIFACLDRVQRADPEVQYAFHELGFIPAALTKQTHALVAISQQAISQTFGFRPPLGIIEGVTDGNFLIDHGIPTVIFGPTGADMHAPNEYVWVSSLLKAARSYVLTAEQVFRE